MRLTLRDCDVPGFLVYACEGNDGEAWASLIPDVEPEAYFNRDVPVEDWRAGANGALLTFAPATVREPGQILTDRIDDSLNRLRDGIAAFDTATAAQRWQTVKIALRIVLALARLHRGRTETDG